MSADNNEVLYSIGYAFLSNGRLQEAEAIIRLLVILTPESSRYWCALGAVEYARKRLQAAAVAFGIARCLDPDDELASVNLGEVALELGERELGRGVLESVASNNGLLARKAGVLLQQAGRAP